MHTYLYFHLATVVFHFSRAIPIKEQSSPYIFWMGNSHAVLSDKKKVQN